MERKTLGFLQNLREVFGKLKRSPPRPIFCPRCRSPEIKLSSRFDVWLFPEQYICQKCGYKGPIVLELEKKNQP
jgi:C4-type Zn-finger protein